MVDVGRTPDGAAGPAKCICGAEIQPGVNFCSICGARIEGEARLSGRAPHEMQAVVPARISAGVGVSCVIPGCTGAVVGQCPGYDGGCGRFYCATHSEGKLCGECAACKARDEETERVYQDYLTEANRIRNWDRKGGRFWRLFLAVIAGMIATGFAVGAAFGSYTIGLAAAEISFLVYLFALAISDGIKTRAMIREADDGRPGFAEFYRAIRKQETKQALAVVGSIAAVAVLTAIADSGRYRMERDLQHIKNRLDMM